MSIPRVLGICGSLRLDSYNRRLLEAATEALPDVDWTIARIRGIPPYDSDIEARGVPPSVQQLKDQIEAADAIVIATPEYNHSIPGVLKNAIDWASRPYGKNAFDGKPTAAIGTAMGNIGTAAAQQHLRSILAYLHVVLMGQPEGYIVFKQGLVDDSHTVTDENVRKFLQTYMDKFGAWVERYGKK